jgi:membrane dipeptidase
VAGLARRALLQLLIVDAHNDLVLELVLRRHEPNPFRAHWLPKLRAGGVALQVCPLFTADVPEGQAPARAREQLEAFERALRENPDDVFAVQTRADLAQVGRDGRIGLMLSFEGVEPVAADFARWWDAGVRMVALTWNAPTWAAGGADTPDRGLTEAGRALLDELNGLGAVLDVAHASPPTFDEVVSGARHVVCSHACCRALEDVPRNLSDDQLRALAGRGGVLGAMALAFVVSFERPTIERFVDHVDHAVEVMGIAHVGLGADVIDQVTRAELAAGKPLTPLVAEVLERGGGRIGLHGFEGPEDFARIVDGLRGRGYDGERLDAITHANFLRVLDAALPEA